MRFAALKAFEDELTRATRGKPFHVRNDIIWVALLDSRDVLFIHFASWAKGCYSGGRFFGRLRADHLPRLFVAAPEPPIAGAEPFEDAFFIERERRVAFERRFARAANDTGLRGSDVEGLRVGGSDAAADFFDAPAILNQQTGMYPLLAVVPVLRV